MTGSTVEEIAGRLAEPNPRDPFARRPFNRDELDTMRDIVAGRLVVTDDLGRSRAIVALAGHDDSRASVEVLTRVILDQDRPLTERVSAAVGMGRSGSRRHQAALLSTLRVEDAAVLSRVFQAVGMAGDADAFEALNGLAEPDEPFVRRQLDLARELIAHRYNLEGDFLRHDDGVERRPGDPEELITLTLSVLDERQIQSDLEWYRGSRYGIDLAEHGFALRAGKALWTIFVNDELGLNGGFDSMFDRKWIAAILGRRNHRSNDLNPQYVVLSSPRPHGAEIRVVRGDGELMYTGSTEQDAGGLAFSMRDVERPGTAPTTVEGHLGDGGFELGVNVPFGSRVGAKAPLAVRPE